MAAGSEFLVASGLGCVLAFVGSVPMTGPLAVIVLDRLILAQRRSAAWIALAGSLVEGFIAAMVATWLPLVLRHSAAIVTLARLSGALVILAVGVALTLRPRLLDAVKTERKRQSFAAGFLTTALNPTLLATWTVTVVALHDAGLLRGGYGTGIGFGLGVSSGALAWFALVIGLARRARMTRLTRHRASFGRTIGLVLAALGAVLFVRAVWLQAS